MSEVKCWQQSTNLIIVHLAFCDIPVIKLVPLWYRVLLPSVTWKMTTIILLSVSYTKKSAVLNACLSESYCTHRKTYTCNTCMCICQLPHTNTHTRHTHPYTAKCKNTKKTYPHTHTLTHPPVQDVEVITSAGLMLMHYHNTKAKAHTHTHNTSTHPHSLINLHTPSSKCCARSSDLNFAPSHQSANIQPHIPTHLHKYTPSIHTHTHTQCTNTPVQDVGLAETSACLIHTHTPTHKHTYAHAHLCRM